MKKGDYVSVAEYARVLGVSRIAVYKKIKKGQIEAVRVGRSYAIPRKYSDAIMGRDLSEKDKTKISNAVKKVFEQYGDVLKLLGRE